MTTYYVRTNGNDGGSGHDGTTPALAWLTPGYAVTHMAAGDTCWVGAGHYRVSSAIAPTSLASMTYLRGDTDGSHTGDAGEVVLSNWTTDTTAANACNTITLANVNYWTFSGFSIINGSNGTSYFPVNITGTSHDLTFQDCTIESPSVAFRSATVTITTVQNITVERCRLVGSLGGVSMHFPASGTGSGDTNANVIFRNCVVIGGNYGIETHAVGDAGTARKTGGMLVANCTILGGNAYSVYCYSTNQSATYPVTVYNSLLLANWPVSAANTTPGTLVEDYNVLVWYGQARVNVSAGANSIADGSRNWRFSYSHEASFGGIIRSFGELPQGSPLLTWGGSSATGVPSDDMNGVTRPASGAASLSKALGPFERSNSGTKETSTVHGGSAALRLAGPGYQDLAVAVAATSTTITVYGRFDSNFGAGSKPTMSVRNGGECGVADATDTMTVAADNWEQLSLNFTPTSVGVVTVRLASLGSAATGITFFDDFAVS